MTSAERPVKERMVSVARVAALGVDRFAVATILKLPNHIVLVADGAQGIETELGPIGPLGK
jgi:hypothetical protein